MNKKILITIASVIATISILSCGSKKPAGPANGPVPVNLYEVQEVHPIYYDQYPGTVTALMQVDIHPEVEGYVTGIFFKEGDHVRKGQKLYEIDESKYKASYDQALANVRTAQGNLDQAQKDADRYIYLNKHDAIAKQILDHAMTTLQNSKNQVNAAKQDLVKAQTDLNYAIIKAPFDGTIGISQVKLGNTVTIGQTTLNTISTDNPMAVDFVIPEDHLGRFITLKKKGYNPADSLFTIRTPDNALYPAPGEISVIDRGVDPQTGTMRIRLTFPNPDFLLRAGMSCTVRVHNDDTGTQLMVPSKAIIEQMGEYFVYMAKDTVMPDDTQAQGAKQEGGTGNSKEKKTEKNDKEPTAPSLRAIQRKVILGQTIEDKVIVKKGLQPGDRIVTDGLQTLHYGSAITTANKQGPQQGGKTTGK